MRYIHGNPHSNDRYEKGDSDYMVPVFIPSGAVVSGRPEPNYDNIPIQLGSSVRDSKDSDNPEADYYNSPIGQQPKSSVRDSIDSDNPEADYCNNPIQPASSVHESTDTEDDYYNNPIQQAAAAHRDSTDSDNPEADYYNNPMQPTSSVHESTDTEDDYCNNPIQQASRRSWSQSSFRWCV